MQRIFKEKIEGIKDIKEYKASGYTVYCNLGLFTKHHPRGQNW